MFDSRARAALFEGARQGDGCFFARKSATKHLRSARFALHTRSCASVRLLMGVSLGDACGCWLRSRARGCIDDGLIARALTPRRRRRRRRRQRWRRLRSRAHSSRVARRTYPGEARVSRRARAEVDFRIEADGCAAAHVYARPRERRKLRRDGEAQKKKTTSIAAAAGALQMAHARARARAYRRQQQQRRRRRRRRRQWRRWSEAGSERTHSRSRAHLVRRRSIVNRALARQSVARPRRRHFCMLVLAVRRSWPRRCVA